MPKGNYVRQLNQNKGKYAVGTEHDTPQGAAVVLERVDFRSVLIKFKNTGYVTKCTNVNLYGGKVKNHRLPSVYGIGYLDGVKIQPRGSEQRRMYDLWANMLRRASQEYLDVRVDKAWHSFKTFMNSLPEVPGWDLFISGESVHLDKDIRVPGSRVYSAATCIFVTSKENLTDAANRRWGNK